MIKTINMPAERLAVLIGKSGEVKREIERRTQTRIEINDEVTIEGDLGVLDAENIVTAISRGFPPEKALNLLDDENTLHIIQLQKTKNSLNRTRARIIGENGKSRKNIERLTRSDIVVYGRTVSIIGPYRNIEYAREAVEKLVKGSRHANVYRYLEDLNARGRIS